MAFVLDDEASVSALVRQFLLRCGYEAQTFASPLPFFAETRKAAPDLIVLDLALGQTDAVDVIRHLEILKYRGRVLLISGRDHAVLRDVEAIGKAHGLAMLPPLQKPFRIHEMKASLEAAADTSVKPAPAAGQGHPAPSCDLAEALRNDWLELWYQPKIDLRTRAVCGAEALMRARHPTRGLVLPVDILPPSHDPLYQPLTRFVLRRAFWDWARLADRDVFLKLAVNVPVSVLCAPDFISSIRELKPSHPRFPGLIVEVTEDEVVRDPESVREVAAQLKLYDVTLSIDDFGTAYSTFTRLLDMPCGELKIDRQFVSNSAHDPLKHGLCQVIVDFAHRLGLTVCAEGVETAGDLRTLVEIGCDTAQGFLFAKPMAADVLMGLLIRNRNAASGIVVADGA